jgi:hypothetical protein
MFLVPPPPSPFTLHTCKWKRRERMYVCTCVLCMNNIVKNKATLRDIVKSKDFYYCALFTGGRVKRDARSNL